MQCNLTHKFRTRNFLPVNSVYNIELQIHMDLIVSYFFPLKNWEQSRPLRTINVNRTEILSSEDQYPISRLWLQYDVCNRSSGINYNIKTLKKIKKEREKCSGRTLVPKSNTHDCTWSVDLYNINYSGPFYKTVLYVLIIYAN